MLAEGLKDGTEGEAAIMDGLEREVGTLEFTTGADATNDVDAG
jgi:hypothetical protein